VLRRCVWSRNIKNGCSIYIYIYIYDISHLRVNLLLWTGEPLVEQLFLLPVTQWNLEESLQVAGYKNFTCLRIFVIYCTLCRVMPTLLSVYRTCYTVRNSWIRSLAPRTIILILFGVSSTSIQILGYKCSSCC